MNNDALNGQRLVTFQKMALAFTTFRNNMATTVQSTIENSLDDVNTRMATCEESVNTMNATVAAMDTTVTSLNSRVDTCETKVASCESKIATCEEKTANYESAVSELTQNAPTECLSDDDLANMLV